MKYFNTTLTLLFTAALASSAQAGTPMAAAKETIPMTVGLFDQGRMEAMRKSASASFCRGGMAIASLMTCSSAVGMGVDSLAVSKVTENLVERQIWGLKRQFEAVTLTHER